ncbi:ATP-dependent zinc metalloprotease FtsH [Gilvimarinus sp. F26214L]|uniref:ATP-dependent zinc metalloprotease FtsH n=1 Tax=Gilvimarinus sp. DZF01 TaxID=3461371 RepID=UPI0040452054
MADPMAPKPDKQPQQQPTRGNPPPVRPFDGHMLMWLFMFFAVYYLFSTLSEPGTQNIPYTEFKSAVVADEVASVRFEGDQIRGTFRVESSGARGADDEPKTFTTVMPSPGDEELLPLLEERGVTITARSAQEPRWFQVLLSVLPWLLILAFFIYSSRMLQQRMGGGGKDGFFSFSKSKARLFESTDHDVGYEDVAGAEGAKQDLQEIVDFLSDPDKFRELGAKMPHGILLMGPPGTGKTLLAKATAHEAGVPFYSISGSEFIEMFVGVGASRVRDMFAEARRRAPALIFIDEIDSVGRVRGTGLGGGNDEREQTLNQVLAEMDGFSGEEAVVVLAATNRPDVLDPALLRPGRFDRKVTLELPQRGARRDILKVHTRKVPLASDVDLDEIAGITVGFSGADLANLVNESALMAARHNKHQVNREDFHKAHDKVVMGSERRDLLNPSERKRTAVHESGHALVALLLPESDPLRQVSIIPRGRALGVTAQLPPEDRHNYSQPYVETRLSVMLGGRSAEKLALGNISSGAANDLEQATRLAKMMVTQWGMSEVIGPVHFRVGSEHPFLGYELTQEKDFSEDTARKIDEEVHRIISEAEARTEKTLRENKAALQKLTNALLEKETLDRAAVDELLADVLKPRASLAANP